MASASLHRSLFLAIIATLFILNASPATATFRPLPLKKEQPSLLVKNICEAKSQFIDYKLCIGVLSTAEANAAEDLKALAVVLFKLAGRTSAATHAAIGAFLQTPEGKNTPALSVCQQRVGQVSAAFSQTLPGEVNTNVKKANDNLRAAANECAECNRAMVDAQVPAPTVKGGIEALRQLTLIGVEITNKMCKEQGKQTQAPSEAQAPSK